VVALVSAVLFAAHGDDETLFAFYSMYRHQAEVVVVLRSMRQQLDQNGPTYLTREAETLCATSIAGVSYVQWTAFSDTGPDWVQIAPYVGQHIVNANPDLVIAPAWEEDGHEDHNALAEIVQQAVLQQDPQPRLINYLTYRRGYGRSKDGMPIAASMEERQLKAQALACYESQRRHPLTAAWFPGGAYADLGEWMA
jgi:LmbE family N-acetylglucosaminyl deacetylase